MKLIYGIKDKPKFGKLIVFAFQQLLAIMAAHHRGSHDNLGCI